MDRWRQVRLVTVSRVNDAICIEGLEAAGGYISQTLIDIRLEDGNSLTVKLATHPPFMQGYHSPADAYPQSSNARRMAAVVSVDATNAHRLKVWVLNAAPFRSQGSASSRAKFGAARRTFGRVHRLSGDR